MRSEELSRAGADEDGQLAAKVEVAAAVAVRVLRLERLAILILYEQDMMILADPGGYISSGEPLIAELEENSFIIICVRRVDM